MRSLQHKLLLFAMLFPATAWAQHSDLEIEHENRRLVVSSQLVVGEFGETPNPSNLADEPGFDVPDGVFVNGESLGFDVAAISPLGDDSRRLWYWDGVGDVAFFAAPHRLTIQHPLSRQSVEIDSEVTSGQLPGVTIGFADDRGGLHQDLEFQLSEAPPADGLYLFGLRMTSPNYADSPTVYFLMNAGLSEQLVHDAENYLEMHVLPEPGTLAFVGFGCVMLRRRQRRT